MFWSGIDPPRQDASAARVDRFSKIVSFVLQIETETIIAGKLGHRDDLGTSGKTHRVNQGQTTLPHLAEHGIGAGDCHDLFVLRLIGVIRECGHVVDVDVGGRNYQGRVVLWLIAETMAFLGRADLTLRCSGDEGDKRGAIRRSTAGLARLRH